MSKRSYVIWDGDLGKFLIRQFSVENLCLTFVTPGCTLSHQLPVKANFGTVLGLPAQWLVGMHFSSNEKSYPYTSDLHVTLIVQLPWSSLCFLTRK